MELFLPEEYPMAAPKVLQIVYVQGSSYIAHVPVFTLSLWFQTLRTAFLLTQIQVLDVVDMRML